MTTGLTGRVDDPAAGGEQAYRRSSLAEPRNRGRGREPVVLERGHRVGTGVDHECSAGAVVAAPADTAEGEPGGGTGGLAVPVHDSRADFAAEVVVAGRVVGEDRGARAIGRLIGLGNRSLEVGHPRAAASARTDAPRRPVVTSGAGPRRRRSTKWSPRTSRAGLSGETPSGPCRQTLRTNSAAIFSAGSSASDSLVLAARAAARRSSWPSPARAAASARPATAATWPRPPPTSQITSSRRCPFGSG